VTRGVVRSRVGHNTLLSFLGLAVPLLLAAFVMPIAARYLGPARFGLLGLAWGLTEYAMLFDFGLGRGLVKFVAEALHQRAPSLNATVSLSLSIQSLAGVLGGVLIFLAAPVIVDRILRIAPPNAEEAIGVFRLVGLSVPVVLLNSGQRGVLEGAERFDLAAILRMLGSVFSLTIAAIGAVLGLRLPVILAIVLAARIALSVLYAMSLKRAMPQFHVEWPRNWSVFRRLIGFGGWVFVSNIVSPVLVYFDRFALGALAGAAAVGFYVAPYEGVTRMLLIPTALFGSLFPALSAIEAGGDRQRFGGLVSASQRVLGPTMIFLVVTVAVFAPELLQIWLGPDYAVQSSTALRLLAIGVLANALAYPQLVTLYAMDRPDIPAKFHVGELIVHIPVSIALIKAYGITGAAAAWALRVIVDFGLLLTASSRISNRSVAGGVGDRMVRLLTESLMLLAGLLVCKYFIGLSVAAGVVLLVTTLSAFALASWRWILDGRERTALKTTVRSYLG